MKRMTTPLSVVAACVCLLSSNPAVAVPMAAPIGGAQVGFTIVLGERTGADALEPATAAEMDSLSVATNGNTMTATWKGHRRLGADLTATGTFNLLPGGGFE